MKRQSSFEKEGGGALFLVPTPIGNMAEISDRVREVLSEADVVAAEDTRNTGRLLKMLNISRPMISHHEHNQNVSIPKIIEELRRGKCVAVCSDAGFPLVSDPGAALVNVCIEEGVPVIPVSGPNAAVDALVASGLPADHFLFYGFLDSKSTRRKKQLDRLKEFPYTLIFYEAPHRIEDMLKDVEEVLGDRRAVLARELTKKFEEFLRGNISEIREAAREGLKGEMVLVVEGKKNELSEEDHEQIRKQAIQKVLELSSTMKLKEAAGVVAKETGLKKNELYQAALKSREESI